MHKKQNEYQKKWLSTHREDWNNYQRKYIHKFNETSKANTQKLGERWTDEEENYLIQNYEKKTLSQIAKKLKRSYYSVQTRLRDIKRAESEVEG